MQSGLIIDMKKAVGISVGDGRNAVTWSPKHMEWDELAKRLGMFVRTNETMAEYAAMSKEQRGTIKDVGGFVGGISEDGRRKKFSIKKRSLLTLDADFGTMDMWEDFALTCPWECVMYTTHSHTPETPRYRLVFPLQREVNMHEYEAIGRKVADSFGIEAFDQTTYEANRLMYWPSCSSDAEPVHEWIRGDWINPDEVLEEYEDWNDLSQWPRSEREIGIVRSGARRQGNPLEKPGLIGAFNRTYSITDAIKMYLADVYRPVSDGRWTYTKGSTIGGAVTFDGDTFLYSWHDTDPCSGMEVNAFDLVRIHLFGDQDFGHEKEPLTERPSMIAMRGLCNRDANVSKSLSDSIRRDPSEAFRTEDGLKRFEGDLTEQGTANEFIDRYGDNLKYSKVYGWMVWDGQKWVLDAESEVQALAHAFSDDLYETARQRVAMAEDKTLRKDAELELRRAVKLRTASGYKNLLSVAQASVYEKDPDSYDRQAWELNTPDGIVDLRTGKVRAHDKNAKHTKVTMASMSDEGREMWDGFIRRITGGDEDFARYLQTMAGMAAVGEVYEEGLVISYGPGGNGKSTLFGALRAVMGDYAKTLSADMLVKTNGNTDQSYVASLRGVRLAIMGETDEGAYMSVSQMKRLTSRDAISARALYKDPIEFVPVHTAVMHTNHLPRLGSSDSGTQRRIAVLPFPKVLPPEQVITNYGNLLVEQAGGAILKWIVEGAMQFADAGYRLVKPGCVISATQAYLQDEDWIGRFLDDSCIVGQASDKVGSMVLYNAYVRWATANNEYTRRCRDFVTALEQAGYQRKRAPEGMTWLGIQVKGE